MQINTDSLLDRFCRYVQIDTQADEKAATYPSSPGQLELGKILVQELKSVGPIDAEVDAFGIVTATIPATVQGDPPPVALFAHLDTSPESSGRNVKPIVHRNYAGVDIVLPGDNSKVLRVQENPKLANLKGKTIITTDGTTLLGADDKAGVAVIMETAAFLAANPDIPHGPIRICFTCDEEIGHGVDHVDLEKLNAHVGYTLDGEGQGLLSGETFSADLAVVKIAGVNIHPGIAKGEMVNSIRLAGAFLQRLPWQALSPETTAEREGFLHPYVISGGVPETTIRILLRDFDTAKLPEKADLLRSIARLLEAEHPKCKVEVSTTKQYRNMAEGLAKEPRAMLLAKEAMRRAGLEPRELSIRGGTDGSQLTHMGLPTPNLSTGEHNPHSPLEWTCLEEMETAARVLVELVRVWAEERSSRPEIESKIGI